MAYQTGRAKGRKEREQRRTNLARAIDLTWSSLRSHLADAVTCASKVVPNEEWESRCVREYGEIIYTLSVELHELAKKDFPVVVNALNRPLRK